jgi:type 1 glutamine amidotransferase
MNKIALLLALVCALMAGPADAQPQFKVLVAAIPNKYHNDYVAVAKPSFEQMARRHNFELVWAWDTRPFDGDLSPYAAIVFLNTPGEELKGEQRQRLENYVRAGGGVMAVHRALIGTPGQWPWFERLIGRPFRTHPYIQTGVIDVVDRNFPATLSLPDRWLWTDEWYEYGEPSSRDLKVVLTVDESTYDPTLIWPGQKAEGMGKHHPVAWYHHFSGGRVFVTALGHTPELYGDAVYLEHLYGGIYWAATGRGIKPN